MAPTKEQSDIARRFIFAPGSIIIYKKTKLGFFIKDRMNGKKYYIPFNSIPNKK